MTNRWGTTLRVTPTQLRKHSIRPLTLESIRYSFMKLIGHLKYNIITLNRLSRYQSTNQNLPHDKNRSAPDMDK
jgi:hypothetical protein